MNTYSYINNYTVTISVTCKNEFIVNVTRKVYNYYVVHSLRLGFLNALVWTEPNRSVYNPSGGIFEIWSN